MRLRRKPWVEEAIREFDDFVFSADKPAGAKQRGKWQKEFARQASLYVELGTGKGDFISKLAESTPEVDFIGIEAQQDVLYSAARKVREAALPNVRLLVFDINELQEIFAPGEVTRFYLNFCDPWPKVRHAKRRLTHISFLEKYRRILAPGGGLFFKTDNRALFDFSLTQFSLLGSEVQHLSYDLHAESCPDNIETEYERKFSSLGEKINYCEVLFP